MFIGFYALLSSSLFKYNLNIYIFVNIFRYLDFNEMPFRYLYHSTIEERGIILPEFAGSKKIPFIKIA